ncbi:sugar-transfer associated ATP-grasp domain-containing protein [Coraliomargarita sinensis]|nr:sugar-transfer associated ATP-grasp domain-containing protein [Coraliomargarita sinensis]
MDRFLNFYCPLVVAWFPWYWFSGDVAHLRRMAGKIQWNNAEGGIKKSILLVKTLVWPLHALPSIFLVYYSQKSNALRVSGRSGIRQLKELFYFTYCWGFAPQDYYERRMYVEELSSTLPFFLSERELTVLSVWINDRWDETIVNNKALFADSSRKMGLPIPEEFAQFKDGQILIPVDGQVSLPGKSLYLKPVSESVGRGIERWTYESSNKAWCFGNEELNDKELIDHAIELSRKDIYVLQEMLSNHPSIECFSEGGLITFRVVTIGGYEKEPEILAAYMSVPMGNAIANHEKYGGLRIEIDLQTNRLKKAFAKQPRPAIYTTHPVTGVQIEGARIEEWSGIAKLASRAQRAFPGVFLIGWDVALAPDGPKLLEGNTLSGSFQGFFHGRTTYPERYLNEYRRKTNDAGSTQ